jgi:hypothetical protein
MLSLKQGFDLHMIWIDDATTHGGREHERELE